MKKVSLGSFVLSVGLLVGSASRAEAEAAPGTARVHLNGDAGLRMETVAPGKTGWSLACRAPCDVALPVDALYRVMGNGLSGSKAFRLEPDAQGYEALDVKPTTEGARTGGMVVAVGGGLAITAGVASVIAYAVIGAGDSLCKSLDQPGSLGGCTDSNPSPPRGLLIGGIVTAAIGGILLVTGLAVAEPTSVARSEPGTREKPEEPARSSERRWTRTPAWREPSSAELAFPRTNTIQIFTTTF